MLLVTYKEALTFEGLVYGMVLKIHCSMLHDITLAVMSSCQH